MFLASNTSPVLLFPGGVAIMEGNGRVTITEIAKLLNKHTNTIYRYIKQKKLDVVTVRQHGKNVVAVEKAEFERFCKDNGVIMLQQVTTQMS